MKYEVKREMGIVKKLIGIVLSVMLLGVMVFAAGCASTKLSDAFDETTVTETAKEVTGYMDEENYDSILEMMREDLQALLPAETLKESADAYIADRGAFKEYKSIAVIGQKIKDTEEDTAVAVVVVSYENQKVTYTITFDVDMKIIGFYLK